MAAKGRITKDDFSIPVNAGVGPDGKAQDLQTDSDKRLKVSIAPSAASGTPAGLSGTVTAGGVAQQVVAANSARKNFCLQNNGTNNLWIRFGATAVQSQPSIKVVPNGLVDIRADDFVPGGGLLTDAISIIGPTTGDPFTASQA